MATAQAKAPNVTPVDELDFEALEELVEENTSSPYAQFEASPDRSGLFVSMEQADRVEFDYTRFDSGKTAHVFKTRKREEIPGFLFDCPKILIVRRSGLYVRNRETGEFICFMPKKKGAYQELKSLGEPVQPAQKHLIFLLDDNLEPLHKDPLQLTTKGAAGPSFSEHLNAFRKECEDSYFQSRGKSSKKMNGDFHCLFSFCPFFESQFVERDGQGADVLRTVGHKACTTTNVTAFTVSPKTQQTVWGIRRETEDLYSKERLSGGSVSNDTPEEDLDDCPF